MNNPIEESNSYLALREAKIKRNEARLKELGLLQKKSALIPVRPVASSSKTKHDEQQVRRSMRNKTSEPNYKDILVTPVLRKRKVEDSSTIESFHQEQVETNVRKSKPSSQFSSNSARSMRINIQRLLQGTDKDGGILGKTMSRTGKAFVMEESARRAVDDYIDGPVSFNKYSGVQEWGNDVLFLWINLFAPNSDVVNEFLNDGRQVTWFGGARMHDETNVIKRLISVGCKPTNEETGIILWCRAYNTTIKGFEPYTCLGRLSYSSHKPHSRPLAFVWTMVDYDKLKSHSDINVQTTFSSMI